MRLLVVEDNPKLSRLMARLLVEGGMVVDVTETAEDARAALAVASYDVILLDLGLPDADGIELLHGLRRRGGGGRHAGSGRHGSGCRRRANPGPGDGADDYLVKPFSLEEMQARIRALLRRPLRAVGPLLGAGNVELDQLVFAVKVAGVGVEMPRQEVLVLAALMRSQGKLLPRTRLEHAVYTLDDEITPNALEAAISRLRRRLDAAEATVKIVSMRGLGWLLSVAS